MENSLDYAFIIEPKSYMEFQDEIEQIDKCRQWGLLSDKASKAKDYSYKVNGATHNCRIVGYVDDLTAVIELDNHKHHCVHPSYLKEMQASSFSQRAVSASENVEPQQNEKPVIEAKEKPIAVERSSKPAKAVKIELPVDKVRMTAIVKEFTTVPNHFADEDDEVVIYESVKIIDPEIEIGLAWSSHSATLKKLELQVGEVLTFDAKIGKKKLTKHPVPYKINNPSKIQKV